jgi:PilZ domain
MDIPDAGGALLGAPPIAEGGRSLPANVYRMLLGRAAGLLVEASVIEVSTDRYTSVEVWTISYEGIHIRASAPRLQVAQDMELTARLSIDGLPHTVSLVIEQADVLSHARASLLLRVVSATPAGYQRQSERIGLAATATLTALICGRIVPNEQVPGQLTDLSESGVRFTTADARPRSDDRMHLYCRFLEGAIDCDVRIARASSYPTGMTILGCAFLDPSPETTSVIRGVLARLTQHPPGPS